MWLAAASGNTVSATQDQIMLALIALVGTSIAALVYIIRNGRTAQGAAEDAATAAAQATAANTAVNNVGPGKHTLYDLVDRIDKKGTETHDTVISLSADVNAIKEDVTRLKGEQDEFDSHGWETLPPDIGTAVALTTTIRDLQNGHESVNTKLDTIISELREHIEWEMDAKYGLHGNKGS